MPLFLPTPLYLAEPRPVERYIVHHLLPSGGLLNIFGPPKEGKTYAALDLAAAISDPARTHFMEWEVMTHGPAWYIQVDTPRALFHTDYLEAAIFARGMNLNDIHFADQQMVPYPFNVFGEGKAFLQKAIAEAVNKPIVVFIDTVRESHGGDENLSETMRNFVVETQNALRYTDAEGQQVNPAIVLISHERKLQKDSVVDLMSGNRGSNALAGRMDAVMRIANGEIRAQGRGTFKLKILSDYKRDAEGFWIKFNANVEIARMLKRKDMSDNARHEAFAEAWDVSVGTAKNWFENYENHGSYKTKKQLEKEAKKKADD